MSEEEKKAIEDLKKLCIEVLKNDDLSNYDNLSPSEKMTMISIILNLIQKQQKELEKKDKLIDLILQDMIDQKCYSTNRTILKKIYEGKAENVSITNKKEMV